MATSRDLKSRVTDLATCPICLELFDKPKFLPCLHTFCLKCLEGHCRDNEPGDEVSCPLCRREFKIPKDGLRGLVGNFFVESLVDARKTSSDVVVEIPCEVCIDEYDEGDHNVPVSTMYCVDCNQKLCELCSRPHRKMRGGPHKVIPIGKEMESELIQTRVGKCDKHTKEEVKLFCFDCKVNVCYTCFAEEHQQHKCKNVTAVADKNINQMERDIEPLKHRVVEARNEMKRLDDERRKLLNGVDVVGEEITAKGEELKRLVDKQVDELILEVQSLNTETCKEIDSHKENIEMKLLALETFIAYCSELKAKGKPCDITRVANDIHNRATELLQTDVKVADYLAPEVAFRPMNINELTAGDLSLLGHVEAYKKTGL